MTSIENLNKYEVKEKFDINRPLSIDVLKMYIDNKLGSDDVTFRLVENITEDSIVKINPTDFDLTEIINFFNESVVEEEDSASLIVIYEKSQGEFNIYSPIVLYQDLKRLSFEHFYNTFNNKYDFKKKIIINTTSDNLTYNTTLFCTDPTSQLLTDYNKRLEILENWSYFTNIQGVSSPRLIPSDFIDNSSQCNDELANILLLFSKFASILSILFLADVVNIKLDDISIKINSYNKLTFKINYKNISFTDNEHIIRIFNWVYSSKQSYLADDKIIFAKNQLSRKLSYNESENTIHIESSTLPSILSMHRIYLKENANQYIETTNTVAELLSKMAVQQKEIQSTIINALKNNSNIFLGLFISLLVFNTLSSGKSTVFNSQNYYLTLLFALISLIGLLMSSKQVERELANVLEQFDDTKKVYTHLFDIDDLNRLFSEEYKANFSIKIKKSRTYYTTIWLIEVVLVITIISILTFTDWLTF
nr:hypothetical protein [Lysinibacillus sphaericus]